MNSFENGSVIDFSLIIGADLLTNILYVQLCEFAFSPIDVVQKTSFQSAIAFLTQGAGLKRIPNLILIDLDGLEEEHEAIRRWHIIVRQTYSKNLRVVYLSYRSINYLFPENSIVVLKPVTVKSLRQSVLKQMPYC